MQSVPHGEDSSGANPAAHYFRACSVNHSEK
jgi:hypothetical protein